MARNAATAFAPAGVGNVAVGFDILGHTLQGVGDTVTVRRIAEPVVRISAIFGTPHALPLNAEENTATAGLISLRRDANVDFGFDVEVHKGIPLGSGMGGSAASAVAAVVAANALLPAPLDAAALFPYALLGETVASGSAHGDNLAPGLLGGLVLVRCMDTPELVRIPVPAHLRCVLVYPHMRVDTRAARDLLDAAVPLATHVQQSANLAGVVAGCFLGDSTLIGHSLADIVVEPMRERLVPGFSAVKHAALDAGALGCSLSGAGPSLFAWCAGDDDADRVRSAMCAAFAATGCATDAWISPVDGPGARLVDAP